MKYLSIDMEATGLEPDDYMIEFAMIPFCAKEKKLEHSLAKEITIKCPSFTELKPRLSQWVIDHNKELIDRSHKEGIELAEFKEQFEKYLTSPQIKEYFGGEKVTLFGKSLSALDLPFMHRDLGNDFMRKYFEHRQLDLTSVAYSFADMGKIPMACQGGSELMNFLEMGEVAHTALEDAVNTAVMYFKLMEMEN